MKSSKNEAIREADLAASFLDEVARLPEGAGALSCIQCGTCSGSCPAAAAMDHTPRQIFAMIRAGMKRQVLESSAPWICASCYKCTVNCPQEIKITEIMYALKRRAIAEKVVPRDPDPERFIRIFNSLVRRFGRGYELGLMLRFMLPGKALELLKQAPVGLRMLREGRLPLLPHRIEDREGFAKMVERALEIDRGESA